MDLGPLWKILKEEEEIDLQEAIKKAGLDPYEGRMAVREVLREFTIKWRKTLRSVVKRKEKTKNLAHSPLFEKVMLLEKCEKSEVTPEGLDLGLWFEKLRYNKTVSIQNPLFDVNSPMRLALTYTDLVALRNGEFS